MDQTDKQKEENLRRRTVGKKDKKTNKQKEEKLRRSTVGKEKENKQTEYSFVVDQQVITNWIDSFEIRIVTIRKRKTERWRENREKDSRLSDEETGDRKTESQKYGQTEIEKERKT